MKALGKRNNRAYARNLERERGIQEIIPDARGLFQPECFEGVKAELALSQGR